MPSSFEIRRDKMRPAITSRIGGTVTRLFVSGPVVRENQGKNGKKMERDGTPQYYRGSLELYQILRLFPEKLNKQYHSRLFLVGTVI